MKSIVAISRNGIAAISTAGALVSGLMPSVLGQVTFEFKDVAGAALGDANGVEVNPGDTFSFDVLVHADASKEIAGLGFKLRFLEYGTGDLSTETFTIAEEPYRVGSPFDQPVGTGFKDEELRPDNETDFGGYSFPDPVPGAPNLFVARIALRVSSDMPPGTYHITPNTDFYKWFDEDTNEYLFDETKDYTVVVVPEPGALALVGALSLLGLGVYRRLSN